MAYMDPIGNGIQLLEIIGMDISRPAMFVGFSPAQHIMICRELEALEDWDSQPAVNFVRRLSLDISASHL